MEKNKKKIDKTIVRIIVFLLVTFVVTYAIEIGVIMPMAGSTDVESQAMAYKLISFCMLFPMSAMFITRVVTMEGLTDMYFVPKDFRRTWKYYLLAWLCPSILIIVGMMVYFIVVPGSYDPNMGYYYMALGEAGADIPLEELQMIAVINIVISFFMAPIVNIANCIGEEWGWRGYLLPKCLEKMSVLPTVIITGVIWGLWHAPLTCIGHNYGMDYPGFPYLGIFAMCMFCIVFGIFLSYVTIRTKSCLPAAIAHAAMNGVASAGLLFTATGGNPFVGPAPTGIVGGIGFVVAAIVIAVILVKEEKANKMQPNDLEIMN